jgi:hypothetical protein
MRKRGGAALFLDSRALAAQLFSRDRGKEREADMRRTAIVSLALALILLAGACGSDDERLTKSEFLKQGNAICKKGNKTISAAEREVVPSDDAPPEPAAVRALFNDTTIPTVKQELDDLEDLEPPKELQDDVDALLSEARDALDETKQQVNEDTAAFLESDNVPFAAVNEKASALGLTVCGAG